MKAANNMEWENPALSKKTIQALGFTLLRVIALFTVLPILGIVIYIVIKGGASISWEFLTSMPRDGMRAGGILPAIIGTFYLTLGTAVFSVPLGIAAAIYLSCLLYTSPSPRD